MNECDHAFTAPAEGAAGRYDLQAVITHELGHALGLGHSDTLTAIMHPNGRGARVRKPHSDDTTALALIYFGRAPAEVEREPATGSARFDPHRALPYASESNLPAPAVRRAAEPPQVETLVAGNAMPADQVSVLSLTAGRGRQVLLYTCEPTLLPPISLAAGQDAKRPDGQRARNNAR